MLMIWPKESNVPDLANEELQEGEVWDKGENYMMKLTEPASIHNRLKVWSFQAKWVEEKAIADGFYKNIMNAYTQIQTNKYFLMIVGYTLGIGNVLNGGTPKGQADGFELSVLGKLVSMKDNTG